MYKIRRYRGEKGKLFLNKNIIENYWYSPDAVLQNVTGQPSISLPTFYTNNNLPLGVQFAGRYAEESVLIDLASQLEQANPWIDKKPSIS